MSKHHRIAAICIALMNIAIVPCYSDVILTPQVSGVGTTAEKNTNILLLQSIDNLPSPLTPELAEQFYLYSNGTVTQGIEPFGYFTPTISKSLDKTTTNNNQDETWSISYHIDPGKMTTISEIHLHLAGEGSQEHQLVELIKNPPFKIGNAFLSQPYEDYKKKLLDTASSLGYIKAEFTTHRVSVNRKTHRAEVYLTFDTGHRYYFAAIHFQKNPLSSNFLDRFVNFRPGKPYNESDTTELQNDLADSSYFTGVSVVPEIPSADSNTYTVPINVYLRPKPRQQYLLGAGFGTDTGPRATIGSNWNYINSYGHQFNALLRLSRIQSSAAAKYIIPGKHPLTDQYNLNASMQTYNYNAGVSQVRQTGAGYTFTRGKWQRALNLSYQIEHYSFYGNPYMLSHLLLPSLSLQYLNSDNILNPTEGSRFNFIAMGAKESIASDTSLAQFKASEKWLHTFNLNHVVILRGDFGYTAIHNLDMLPLSLNFFTGGSQTVRGYGYNTLGPGRYLIDASAEYRYRVHGNWFAASFIDIGNAFNNFPAASNNNWSSKLGAIYNSLQRGVGIGAVWNSPVGTLELTVAKAVTAPGQPNRIQFNMGTDL